MTIILPKIIIVVIINIITHTYKGIILSSTGSKFIPRIKSYNFCLVFLVNPKQGLVYFQETKRKSCC